MIRPIKSDMRNWYFVLCTMTEGSYASKISKEVYMTYTHVTVVLKDFEKRLGWASSKKVGSKREYYLTKRGKEAQELCLKLGVLLKPIE